MPTDIVKSGYVKDILEEDDKCELKLAPKLRPEFLDSKNHFLKMRVNCSTWVFNDNVSSALEFLTNENLEDERLTTAWFISFMARWFHIVSSKDISVALGLANLQKYNETIHFLEEFIELFRGIRIGVQGSWKPFQTAILISTRTIIDLSKLLLNSYNLKFFFLLV